MAVDLPVGLFVPFLRQDSTMKAQLLRENNEGHTLTIDSARSLLDDMLKPRDNDPSGCLYCFTIYNLLCRFVIYD